MARQDSFASVSKRALDINSLSSVLDACQECAVKWNPIGLQFGLAYSQLEEIAVTTSTPRNRLQKVLAAWLQKDTLSGSPDPSYYILCHAVAEGGGNPALADRIAAASAKKYSQQSEQSELLHPKQMKLSKTCWILVIVILIGCSCVGGGFIIYKLLPQGHHTQNNQPPGRSSYSSHFTKVPAAKRYNKLLIIPQLENVNPALKDNYFDNTKRWKDVESSLGLYSGKNSKLRETEFDEGEEDDDVTMATSSQTSDTMTTEYMYEETTEYMYEEPSEIEEFEDHFDNTRWNDEGSSLDLYPGKYSKLRETEFDEGGEDDDITMATLPQTSDTMTTEYMYEETTKYMYEETFSEIEEFEDW